MTTLGTRDSQKLIAVITAKFDWQGEWTAKSQVVGTARAHGANQSGNGQPLKVKPEETRVKSRACFGINVFAAVRMSIGMIILVAIRAEVHHIEIIADVGGGQHQQDGDQIDNKANGCD